MSQYLLDQLVRQVFESQSKVARDHLMHMPFLPICTPHQPPPSADDEDLVKKLRKRLQDLLSDLRKGAEGVIKDSE